MNGIERHEQASVLREPACSKSFEDATPLLALAPSMRLMLADAPLLPEELTPNERALHEQLSEPRRQTWLLGRAALKSLLGDFRESPETAQLGFPHPRFSVTHTREYAAALGARDGLDGVGVDMELDRPTRLEAARFFLTVKEQDWIRKLEAGRQQREMLRLWTVKEAVFKADLNNTDFRIINSPILLR